MSDMEEFDGPRCEACDKPLPDGGELAWDADYAVRPWWDSGVHVFCGACVNAHCCRHDLGDGFIRHIVQVRPQRPQQAP